MSETTMTPEQIALARRATTLTGWKWMPGMLVWGGGRITERTLGVTPGVVPDLLDPTGATDGALLRLLGDIVGNLHRLGTSRGEPYWAVYCTVDKSFYNGDTLAEACCRVADALGYWRTK